MSDKEIKPVIKADPLYQMLRQEDVEASTPAGICWTQRN